MYPRHVPGSPVASSRMRLHYSAHGPGNQLFLLPEAICIHTVGPPGLLTFNTANQLPPHTISAWLFEPACPCLTRIRNLNPSVLVLPFIIRKPRSAMEAAIQRSLCHRPPKLHPAITSASKTNVIRSPGVDSGDFPHAAGLMRMILTSLSAMLKCQPRTSSPIYQYGRYIAPSATSALLRRNGVARSKAGVAARAEFAEFLACLHKAHAPKQVHLHRPVFISPELIRRIPCLHMHENFSRDC
jgi:hypothetical protein